MHEAVMEKLLVVDDDELVRLCVTSILAAVGYDVVEAKDGLEALSVYQAFQEEVCLVIMDITMPRMDGISAAKIIKYTYPSSKVILMSGRPEPLPAEPMADAFLPKPFRSRELLEKVQQVLQGELPLPWVIKQKSPPQNEDA